MRPLASIQIPVSVFVGGSIAFTDRVDSKAVLRYESKGSRAGARVDDSQSLAKSCVRWYNSRIEMGSTFGGGNILDAGCGHWRSVMPRTTITFEVGGRIDIKQFEEGIIAFRRLVSALTGSRKVDWVISDLQPGSAIATLEGECDNPQITERIVREYELIGESLQKQKDIRASKRVKSAVNAVVNLTSLVEYVRFETSESNYTVFASRITPIESGTTDAIGSVTGTVQILSNRGSLRFNLYDTIFDKAVSCYLSSGQEQLMREVWGQRATVSGRVTRDAETGRPITIRQIMSVEALEEQSLESFREARGAVPWVPGDQLPEEAIRRLRDA